MRKTGAMLAGVALLVVLAAGARPAPPPTEGLPSVTLAWDPSADGRVSGYKVYWGAGSRTYTNSVTTAGLTNTQAVVAGLARGVTYFFAATCFTTNGLESDFSLEVSYTTSVLPGPPYGVRVSTRQW